MLDAYQRIEADVVAVGEFLERARRYRPLAEQAREAYRRATEIAARVRRASRQGSAEGDLESLAEEIHAVVGAAEDALARFLSSAPYRELIESLDRQAPDAAARIAVVFADIEPASALGDLYFPLATRSRRGRSESGGERSPKGSALEETPGVLEPEAVAESVARMTSQGIEPQAGPGVGADERVRPVRFFEGIDGVDAPVVLVASAASSIAAPTFRAPEVGEVLVYARRLRVPFAVGLRRQSPDDWLELRAGGYAEYRRRCRELIEAAGGTVIDVGD